MIPFDISSSYKVGQSTSQGSKRKFLEKLYNAKFLKIHFFKNLHYLSIYGPSIRYINYI